MVNVDPRQRSSRYVSNDEGAPPVPPAGGYRGAIRPRESESILGFEPNVPVSVALPDEPRTRSVLGWIALVVAGVFAIVLLLMLALGAVNGILSITAFAVQLAVLGVIVAALFSPTARRLGAIALAVTLMLNVATVGAMGSARSVVASGGTEVTKSDEDKLWEQYPGVKDVSPSVLQAQPSLEQVRERSEAAMAEIRTALTAEFGYTWAAPVPESLSPVRNGYGGESMLQAYTSSMWMTEQKITDLSEKRRVMNTIDDVLARHEMMGIYPLNDPKSGQDPSILIKLYGADELSEQAVWTGYSRSYDDVSRFYADIYDLSRDSSGTFTKTRQAQHDRTGEPLEGVELAFISDMLLSDADADAFTEALKKYP